jgi:hypothetical protein
MKSNGWFALFGSLALLVMSNLACNLGGIAPSPTSNIPLVMMVSPTASPLSADIAPSATASSPAAASIAGTTETAPEASSSAQSSSASPAQGGTPILLDPCILLTQDEAARILGRPAARQPSSTPGNCIYVAGSGAESKSLIIGAAMGEEAKSMTLAGVQVLLMFSSSDESKKIMEELQASAKTVSLNELVVMTVKAFELMGSTIEAVPAIADEAYWLMNDKFGLAELLAVKGDVYVFVTASGRTAFLDKDTATALVKQAFERLPSNFSVLGESAASAGVKVTVELKPEPTATTAPAYKERPSYTGDCNQRKKGTTCLRFNDKYIWLVGDTLVEWASGGTYEGNTVSIARCSRTDYYHVLNTNLVKSVRK